MADKVIKNGGDVMGAPLTSRATAYPLLNERGETTRSHILDAVQAEIVERGATAMTVSSISKRANLTRSLFYHYFATKDEAASAVLDSVIDDFLAQVRHWNEGRELGNVDKALDDAVHLMCSIIDQDGPFSMSLAGTGNGQLYLQFIDRAADRIAHFVVDNTVEDFRRHHEIKIGDLYETFYMLIVGLISLMRTHPDISEAAVKRIVAHTLQIDDLVQLD